MLKQIKLQYLLLLFILIAVVNARNVQQQKQQQKYRYVVKEIPELGKIRGRILQTQWSGRNIAQFLDIPYGKSTGGNKRFKASTLVEPWNGILNAYQPHIGCPSFETLRKLKQFKKPNINFENCLRLSINSKSLTGSAPVMVYIHGEFLSDGDTLEAVPNYLLEEDIVLVAVRYRLGPFGFLSTMTEDIPGNAAIHDIILALQWIQKHISVFGGDPKRVTLFGQTGGAALINTLVLSPKVPDNLFHRVIYQSATAMSPVFLTDEPITAAKDIAKQAGCKNLQNIDVMNKCLHNMNATVLIHAYRRHIETKSLLGIGAYGGAQIVIGGPSDILPKHPGKLLVSEEFKAYPTLGGTVKNAGTFLLRDIYMENFNESIVDDLYNGASYIDYIVKQTNGEDPTNAWQKFAEKEIFTKEQLQNGTFYALAPGLIDLCGTIAFKNPIVLTLQSNAKKMPNSTFLYSFDYAGEINRYIDEYTEVADESVMPFEMGVTLSDDNLYLFPWPKANSLTSVRDQKVAKRMVALWSSFAKTGIPNVDNLPMWPPMSNKYGPYMKIGETMTIGNNYLDEFTVTVRETKLGHNLINNDFFDNLVDVDEILDNNGVQYETLKQKQQNQQQQQEIENDERIDNIDDENNKKKHGASLIFIANHDN